MAEVWFQSLHLNTCSYVLLIAERCLLGFSGEELHEESVFQDF
jgi:hypothetical protein